MPASRPHLSHSPVHRLIFTAFALVLLADRSLADDVDFVRDIRPIISENCSFCHGPDEATREADLRLDTAAGAWSVLEKNHSDQSELVRRITTDDADELMPPADSNRSLSPREKELIRRWIDQGAQWEQHWSFRPIVAPDIPKLEPNGDAPIRNSIDAFVQSELTKNGLSPSPQASRTILIRRLSLDLTGLPPTPQQVDAFLADDGPDAYERLVDQLLDSPAYGQRMAWDWLDAARYADTNGYQGDRERTMWPWRDWVVDAFNDNMPFDQFTVWQLAGDLLPNATHEQKLATAFCRNHMINGEGGRIAEENRIEYVMDMSETMGTVWLGLTLNCCRCHDHKYDPIKNEEYYQFFAFFNQTTVNGGGGDPQTPPNLATPSPEQNDKLASIKNQIASLDSKLKEMSKSLASDQPLWEQSRLKELAGTTQWHQLRAAKIFASGSRLRTLYDNSVLTAGEPPDNDTYTFFASTPLSRLTGIRIEAMRHESMTEGSLSLAGSGNFVLTEIEVSQVADESDQGSLISIASAEATFEQGGHQVTNAFDGDPKTGWAVYDGRVVDREHTAVFRFKEPVDVKANAQIKVVLRHDSQHQKHNLGRFRLSLTDTAEPKLTQVADQLLAALETPTDKRNDEQRKLLTKAHRESAPEYKALQDQRDNLVKQRNDLENSFPKVMVMADMATPRETFILQRGLYNKPTETVAAKLPAFLPADRGEENVNRLTLARWLVDPNNPLTARVTVNRFWQQVFGVGLVKTTEDFGAQGEIPVHMDLLNWLAKRFQGDGWDVKNLLRLIVTSHTYRQSSKITDPVAYERDPANRLLARGARYRMSSWMLRDQVLAASGLLSPADGGAAVNTYQPPGIWEEASFGKKQYKQDEGEKLYRRSLYTYWRRIIAPTMFFDNASRQNCTVKSSRTNTPLHALQTLNNVAYVEAARVLAEASLKADIDSDADRIDFVTRRTIARPASDAEKEVLLRGLAANTRAIHRQTRRSDKTGVNWRVIAGRIDRSGRARCLDQPVPGSLQFGRNIESRVTLHRESRAWIHYDRTICTSTADTSLAAPPRESVPLRWHRCSSVMDWRRRLRQVLAAKRAALAVFLPCRISHPKPNESSICFKTVHPLTSTCSTGNRT